ncbi:MarC family protein, partial [Glaesserella parasuis]
SFGDQVITTGIMLSVLLITYILFLVANRIQHFIGHAGAAIISRVMGLILSAVAINNILLGLKDFITQAQIG